MAVMSPQPMTTASGPSQHPRLESSQEQQYHPKQPYKLAGHMEKPENRTATRGSLPLRQRPGRKLNRAKSETALNGIRQLRSLHQVTRCHSPTSTMLNCIDGRTVSRKLRDGMGGKQCSDDIDDDGLRGLEVLEETTDDTRGNDDVLLLQYTDDESEEDDDEEEEEERESLPSRPPSIACRRRAVSDSKVVVVSGYIQYHYLMSPSTVKRVPPRWRIKATASI